MRVSEDSRQSGGSKAAGDIGELYGELSGRLQRIVRCGVQAPESVIEDACQFAWTRLVDHHDRVRRATTLPWLIETARHEAFRIVSRQLRDHSLEATLETRGEEPLHGAFPGPDDLTLAHERLAQLQRLPPRQQRLMWLHGVGLTYAEMARYTGDTPRTIERQLLRAKRAVRGFALE
jgi:RNA polymerase sigma factor (sigma-70 family)